MTPWPKRLLFPFAYLLYIACRLVPRNASLWMLGAWEGRRFADNPRYLYGWLLSNREASIRCVWGTRDRQIVRDLEHLGLPVVNLKSVRGMWLALRAGVHIHCSSRRDLHPWLSNGAVRVNLWHGTPLKQLNPPKADSRPAWRRALFRADFLKLHRLFWDVEYRYDLAIAPSAEVAKLISEFFGITLDRVPITGYPRNDVLLAPHTNMYLLPMEETWRASIREMSAANKTIFLYMPTFRDTEKVGREIPIDWGAMDMFLGANQAVLLVKVHPAESPRLPPIPFKSIRFMPSSLDVYPLLPHVSALITDYSSIYFDFALLNRPIIFYSYDLAAYISRDRPLYFDYAAVSPGPKAATQAELIRCMKDAMHAQLPGEHDSFVQRFYPLGDGSACRRVTEAIKAVRSP